MREKRFQRLIALAAMLSFLLIGMSSALADYPSVLNAAPEETIDRLGFQDRTVVTSDNYIQFVKDDIAAAEAKSGRPSCGDFTVGARDKFFLVDPAGRFFPPPALPMGGPSSHWYERWTITSCGQPGYRAVVIERGPAGFNVINALPGASHADPALQIATLAVGKDAFNKTGCAKNFQILDTQIIEDSRFADHSWRESWTIQRCGNDVATRQVQYGPDRGLETSIQIVDDTATP